MENSVKAEERKKFLWWLLGLIFPVVGFAFFFCIRKKDEEKAKEIRNASLEGVAVIVIATVISSFLFKPVMAKRKIENIEKQIMFNEPALLANIPPNEMDGIGISEDKIKLLPEPGEIIPIENIYSEEIYYGDFRETTI